MTAYQNIEKLSLYHYQTCPFCDVARKAIKRLGLEIPLHDIKKSTQHRADLIKGGGKPQVPCLKIQAKDGSIKWMYESLDIVEYLKEMPATNGR